MKLMEKMRQKKLGNKGFTLVELIIVIAIMAILLGIVGTQVIPYLNRAREAKDLQIINSYCTATVSAYSINAELFENIDKDTDADTVTLNVKDFSTYISNGKDEGVKEDSSVYAKYILASTIQELVGDYGINATASDENPLGSLNKAMSSSAGKEIADVEIVINVKAGEVTAKAIPIEGSEYASNSLYTTPVKAVIGSPATP